jgi:hypothetical protein
MKIYQDIVDRLQDEMAEANTIANKSDFYLRYHDPTLWWIVPVLLGYHEYL